MKTDLKAKSFARTKEASKRFVSQQLSKYYEFSCQRKLDITREVFFKLAGV